MQESKEVAVQHASLPKKLALETWGIGKPELLAMFAHQAALAAEPFYLACKMAREKKSFSRAGLQPPLEIYKNPEHVWNSAEALFYPELGRLLREYKAALKPAEHMERRLNKAGRINQRQFNEWLETGRNVWRDVYHLHLRELRNQLCHAPKPPIDLERRLGAPVVQFFFSVYVPCWMEYRVRFPVLLQQATNGNLENESQILAFEKLLRIDKFCIVYPPVNKLYAMVMASKRDALIKRLQNGHAGEPLKRLTKRSVEIALGALILKVAKRLDGAIGEVWKDWRQRGIRGKRLRVRLTAPDISRLFDAAADDCNGTRSDEDNEIFPHSYYMALKRDMELWPDLEPVSQKSWVVCEGAQ